MRGRIHHFLITRFLCLQSDQVPPSRRSVARPVQMFEWRQRQSQFCNSRRDVVFEAFEPTNHNWTRGAFDKFHLRLQAVNALHPGRALCHLLCKLVRCGCNQRICRLMTFTQIPMQRHETVQPHKCQFHFASSRTIASVSWKGSSWIVIGLAEVDGYNCRAIQTWLKMKIQSDGR